MEITNTGTAELIDDYYASWRNGIASFDEARVKGVLVENLDFEGRRAVPGVMRSLRARSAIRLAVFQPL